LKFPSAILFLSGVFFLCSCSTVDAGRVTISSPKIAQLNTDHLIKIEVNTGEVLIVGTQDRDIQVLGSITSDPALTYAVEQSDTGLHILAQYPKRIFPPPASNPVDLEIRVPPGYQIQFIGEDANLAVRNYSGKLDVSSTAGDVLLDGFTGSASIKANRGDVTLRASQGELYALGNYGLLALEEVHGQVSASTIMGTIRYRGTGLPGDALHFESDHGPIEITLAGQPDLSVKVNSTSGDVVCMFSALVRDPRTCSGILGNGSAQLDVRTVSGAITFQQVP